MKCPCCGAAELIHDTRDLPFGHENGKTKPPLALVKWLKVLDRHPDLLSEVRAG